MSRLLSLLFFLTAFAGSAVQAEAPPDYYLMRHLEGRGVGHDERLSEVGAMNAQRLAGWFKAEPPAAIYVSATQVSLDTSAWLATELGINPKLYDPQKLDALVETVSAERGPVLIVGHDNVIAQLLAKLTGSPSSPAADIAVGKVWIVTGAEKKLTVSDLYPPAR
jgi:broad specificity phosphatase PhoE